MPDPEVGGNGSRCDGCTVFEHCAGICEDCEEKTSGACVDGCPMDCGVLGDGDGEVDEPDPHPETGNPEDDINRFADPDAPDGDDDD
jgi:hypothetical protein